MCEVKYRNLLKNVQNVLPMYVRLWSTVYVSNLCFKINVSLY